MRGPLFQEACFLTGRNAKLAFRLDVILPAILLFVALLKHETV